MHRTIIHTIQSALKSKLPLLAIVLAGVLLLMVSSAGIRRVSAVSITTLGTPITQNFDTLASSGTTVAWTDDSTLPGWYAQFTVTPSNPTTYTVGTGSSIAGAIYSFGVAGTNPVTDRAFGSVASGTPGDIFYALKLTNNTGSTITSLDISYTGEQWRNGGNTSAQQLDFQYQVASVGTITDANTPSTGWTDFNALDFVSPVTGATAAALDGNAAANRTAKSANLPVTVNDGQEIWLRWKDTNDAGNDHGLAIDDFSVTANGSVVTPTLNIGDVTQAEGDSGTTTFTFNVSLTAPAGAGGVSFTVNTADGTTNPANAGSDYVAIVNGSGSISQGNSSTTVNVTVNGDTTPEPNETFFVNISNITGATAGDVQGLGTITNDDVTITPIHDIQGSGDTSPFAGQTLTTTGIVTGVKTNGFFIQVPDANIDGNPNTSEGIFVFTSSAPPAAATVGNSVNVTGMVQEFIPSADPNSPPATEIAGSPSVSLLSTGNPLPTPITLTTADTGTGGTNMGAIDNLEKYEGMRVSVTSLTVIAPTQGTVNEPNATSTSNGVFYGVITGVARPFREPGVQLPDPLPAGSPCCVPRFDANPERLRVDSDGLVGAAQLEVTSGATIANVTGPLDYAFRTYTIDPDPGTLTQASVIGNVSATPVPVPLATEFTVGSFNMERFFDTVNDGNGAPTLTATAFNNRLNKASLAIRNVMRSPDILGVEEMENITTLQAVATKVNMDTVAGGGSDPNYQAYLVEGNDIGGIDVGFLVKASRVTVIDVTQFGKDTTYINPNNGQPELLNDRPPLVLRATISGLPITVIVNHLRSLSGVDDPADGNRVRTKRRAQAEFLANLIQPRQMTENIVSVGDYNVFEFNDGYVDSMGTIKGTPTPSDQVVLASSDLVDPNLTDLIDFVMPATQKYSYSFDGNAQTLDHELITQNLMVLFSHVNYARNDADFPESFRNDANRPERISDHDMAVAYFNLPSCTLTCPGNVMVSNDQDQCAAIVNYNAPTTSGQCGTVTCSPASGSSFPVGTTTVTCTSSFGPSCSFTVMVNDTQPPSITCPSPITQSTDPNVCTALVSYSNATATDNCSGVGTPSCVPASGSTFQKGVTTVSCTVSDASNNPANCSFTVTVNDTQPPAVTCPAPITQNTDANVCTAVVTFADPTVTDNCPPCNSGMEKPVNSPQVVTGCSVVCSPASGSMFQKGVTTVTCTAMDASNNTAQCSFTVTVNDTQAPSITCPSPITHATDPNVCTAVVTFTPTATDNCPLGPNAIVCNPASGATFQKGVTTVTCTATDTSNNTANCSFTVTVNDTQAPSITCPSPITQPAAAGQCSAMVTYSNATATDNCSGVGTPSCLPASGSTFQTGVTTVTCTVTDASSNSANCTFTVTVNDTQNPTVTCPANMSFTTPGANDPCGVVTYTTPAGSDNCGVQSVNCSPASGSCFPVGMTTVTCTATDTSGNKGSCTFKITVQNPCTITCPANITKSNDLNQCGAVVTFAPTTTGSGCGTVNCSPASGSFFPKGTTTVTCTTAGPSCSFTVTVNDTQPPVFPNGCPAAVTNAGQVSCPFTTSIVTTYTTPVATDNCSPPPTVVCNPPSGSTFPPGTTMVTCTATDSSGNTAACSFAVNVFSFCLQDDSNPGLVVFVNAVTGEYLFCSNGVAVASGIGTLVVHGCNFQIDHTKGDRKVHIQGDTSANSGAGSGTAFIQKAGGGTIMQITDRKMSNDTCTCSPAPPPASSK